MNKILVVEDDRDMCRMISSILKEEGYRVDKAYDAEGAIKKIKAKCCDLIILDYKLPDMDGIKVLEDIRCTNPSLKVIMISAYGSPSIKSMAKKLGVYQFLDKPFDLNRLIKVVKMALQKSQGEVNRSSTLKKGNCPRCTGETVESGMAPLSKSGIWKRKEV